MWYRIHKEDYLGPWYGPYENKNEAIRLAQWSAGYADLHGHPAEKPARFELSSNPQEDQR